MKFEYFEKLIEEINHSKLKIYLYHIPQVSGVGLSIDLVSKLKKSYPDIVVGIKDSSGDWENTKSLVGIDDLTVYPGAELPVIQAIKLGAPGCISATANLNGGDISKVINFCHNNEWEKAEDLHKKVTKVRLLFQDYAPIPAQKGLLAKKTKISAWLNVRPPLKSINDDKVSELANTLNNEFGYSY